MKMKVFYFWLEIELLSGHAVGSISCELWTVCSTSVKWFEASLLVFEITSFSFAKATVGEFLGNTDGGPVSSKRKQDIAFR